MKVAIIGGGMTGLACAVELVDRGTSVSIFEEGRLLGGLANSFKVPGWEWSLEKYYHHIFSNDVAIIEMAKKVDCPALFTSPKTCSLINGEIEQLDSPISVLKFSALSFSARLRMGAGLAGLKIIKNGLALERFKVTKALPVIIGREAYEVVWEKLLNAKFGKYIGEVNLAWFWARVAKRTQALGYFEGGFEGLTKKMAKYIKGRGGEIFLGKRVVGIEKTGTGKYRIDEGIFDKVVVTTPAVVANQILGKRIASAPNINYLWGQTLVLELNHSLMNSYWLNILGDNWPFLVAVEHTNFIDKKHYGGKVIVYLGNYLEDGVELLNLTDKELLTKYLPYLKKINNNFNKTWVERSWKFQSPFAQPVFPVKYSEQIPTMQTSDPNIFMANMSMVYPWDRGTNYAVEMGVRAAKAVDWNLRFQDTSD